MLSVLIASQLKTITPMLLIPRALDKTPRLDAIAKAESMSIASAQELYLRACKRRFSCLDPSPSRPSYRTHTGLRAAWRDVNAQALDVTVRHCLKVLGDGLEMPARDK